MKMRYSQLVLYICALGCGLLFGSLATAMTPALARAWTLREALSKAHAKSPVNVIFRDADDQRKVWEGDPELVEAASIPTIARHYGYTVRRVGSVSLLVQDLPAIPSSSNQLASLNDWISSQLPGGDEASALRAMEQYKKSYQMEAQAFAAELPMGTTPLASLRPDQQTRALQLLRENKVESHLTFLAQLLQDID